MNYQNPRVAEVAEQLKKRLAETKDKPAVLRAPELRALYAEIPSLPEDQRAGFGKEINELKTELQELVNQELNTEPSILSAIDVTAPFDVNTSPDKQPQLLPTTLGSKHPLMTELDKVLEIFARMGFAAVESPQLDNQYYMFDSLNFPEGHPAREDYDTFVTVEKDKDNKPFVAPAHASVMQNRLLKRFKDNLDRDEPISAVYTGRTFRNEDVDARHEHTFYQVEIIHVDKNINAGNLIATFKIFLSEYYQQNIEVKSQPFYFPFTEPSFELVLSCPFCKKQGCTVCGYTGWIELLGMGMVHPNVLKMADIDPNTYTGFAGGLGFDRLVMIKHNIEDVRHFESGRLDFLRQFNG